MICNAHLRKVWQIVVAMAMYRHMYVCVVVVIGIMPTAKTIFLRVRRANSYKITIKHFIYLVCFNIFVFSLNIQNIFVSQSDKKKNKETPCLYCEPRMMTNFDRHIKTVHKKKERVSQMALLQLKGKRKEAKKIRTWLRKQGILKWNKAVIEKGLLLREILTEMLNQKCTF